ALIGGIRLVMGLVTALLVTAPLGAAPLGASPPQDPATPSGASQATGESLPWLAGVGARLQLRHTWETPEDRHTTAVQRGRIWARGEAQDRFTYLLQAEVAGSSIRLLDAQLSTPVVGPIHLTVGQGKAPFGRQQLNSSGALSLVDRSLADGRFTPARRAGIKVHGMSSNGRVTWAAGRFEARGVGDDPGISGRSMTAGRIVATPFGPYPAVESALGIPDGPRLALGVAGLTTTEDRGGKAVGLTRWNAETALRAGRVQVVSELFREVPGTSGEAAHLAESSEVERVWPRAWGGYVQMGVLVRSLSHEVVARHSWIRADSLETEERESLGGGNQGDSFETGIGYTRYLDGHRAKLQGDVHRLRETASGATGTRIRLQVTLTLW
ncbi:MAG: hypothetical protein EA422_14665, partial [Gemmatimonadales bacterium]